MKGIHLIAIVMLTASIFAVMHIPIEKQIPYEDKESYFVDVPYQNPIYKTVEHSDPVYDTKEHSDPVYETLYTFILKDDMFLDYNTWTVDDVYDIEYTHTGTDFWSNSNYNVILYYYVSLPDGRKTYRSYNEINSWSATPHDKIVTYDEWNEQVVIGYNTWTEEVVDYYDTAYRPEKRYRTVTKHMPITKPAWEWIDIWVNGKKLSV